MHVFVGLGRGVNVSFSNAFAPFQSPLVQVANSAFSAPSNTPPRINVDFHPLHTKGPAVQLARVQCKRQQNA